MTETHTSHATSQSVLGPQPKYNFEFYFYRSPTLATVYPFYVVSPNARMALTEKRMVLLRAFYGGPVLLQWHWQV